jgi:protein gp37
MAARQAAMGTRGYGEVVTNGKWNGKTVLVESELDKPMRWRKPSRIFVCSMSDLFHESVSDEQISEVMRTIILCPQHTFLILTKRPAKMRSYIDKYLRDIYEELYSFHGVSTWPMPNLHLGVTAENQEQADKRIPQLIATPAAKRFVSIEPMLGPVCLFGPTMRHQERFGEVGIDGVICGGESGPGARPMDPQWVRRLRDQCAEAGVAFMFKQWGGWAPESVVRQQVIGLDATSINNAQYEVLNGGERVYRVGKHRAGRMLDGREHNEVA